MKQLLYHFYNSIRNTQRSLQKTAWTSHAVFRALCYFVEPCCTLNNTTHTLGKGWWSCANIMPWKPHQLVEAHVMEAMLLWPYFQACSVTHKHTQLYCRGVSRATQINLHFCFLRKQRSLMKPFYSYSLDWKSLLMGKGHYQKGETGKHHFAAWHFKYRLVCIWSHGWQV